MELADRPEVLPELLGDRRRQHGSPVLVSLAGPDRNLPAFEVDVLDPQPQALHDTHPGPVEQSRHQFVDALQLVEDGRNRSPAHG